MPSTNCFCGAELSGADTNEQVTAGVAHFEAEHPQIPITATGVRNFIEREPMLTGGTERLDTLGEVSIVPLAPERLDDVLAFFDHDAFADFPGWAGCYCIAHHCPDESEWADRSWQRNRADLVDRINAGTTSGVLAYVDGRLAGWCNASKREAYPHYARGEDDTAVGVVACFVMAPPYRGHGLARRLLEAAVEQFRSEGMAAVEGHCATNAVGPQASYRGTIPLYESQGFEVAHRGEQTTVMRKAL